MLLLRRASFRCSIAIAGATVAALGSPGAASAALAPGDLDPAFGAAGVAVVDPSLAAPRSSGAGDIAVDGQGRLLVAGTASDENGKTAAWAGRLQPGGAIDPSFGDGWRSVFQLGIGGTGAYRPFSTTSDVLALAGGKVGLVPYRIINESNSDASLLRLRENGQRDADHGTNGLGGAATPAAPAAHNANAGLGNDDGGVFLGGAYDASTTTAGGRNAAWWKLDAFGQPVSMPGEGFVGLLQASQAPAAADRYSSIAAMVRVAGGKTLVVGSTTWTDTRGAGFVARLLPSGQLDTGFGATGPGFTVVQARDPSGPAYGDSSLGSVAVGPDGVIYAAGSADDGSGNTAFSVVRLGPGGIVDPSFGSQGIRRFQLAGGTYEHRRSDVGAIVVQPDGRPVLVGNVDDSGSDSRAAAVRLLADGALDPSFGAAGIVRLPSPAGTDRLSAGDAVLAPPGRITIAGAVTTGSVTTAAAARFTLEPVADPPPVAPGPGGGTLGPGSGSGAGSAPIPPPPSDRVKPRITGLRVTFDAKRLPLVRFTASEPARVTVLVERVRKGRKRSGRCAVRARRGPRCTTYTKVKSTTRSMGAGVQTYRGATNALVLSATYRVTITANDAAGNRSQAVRATAKVRRPPR